MKTLDRRLTRLEELTKPDPPRVARTLSCFYGGCDHGPECSHQGLRGLAAFYGAHGDEEVDTWITESLASRAAQKAM